MLTQNRKQPSLGWITRCFIIHTSLLLVTYIDSRNTCFNLSKGAVVDVIKVTTAVLRYAVRLMLYADGDGGIEPVAPVDTQASTRPWLLTLGS